MARIVTNNEINNLPKQLTRWAYNALDCCVTGEVEDVLVTRLDPATQKAYNFEMACQAPAMAMMLRGIMVDEVARDKAIKELEDDEAQIEARVEGIVAPIWGKFTRAKGKCSDGKNHAWPRAQKVKAEDGTITVIPPVSDEEAVCAKCNLPRLAAAGFNPRSTLQVKELFYKKMMLPVQHSRKRKDADGHPVAAVDDECLERLAEKFPAARPFTDGILEARRVRKQIGFLKSKLSSDGRMRSSFNVGAAETFRWSSSKSPYMVGTNVQNVADRSRYIFIADPGFDMFETDLKQAESKCVAYDAQDDNYIRAHEEGDVHTAVCTMCWPEMHWTGNAKDDRALAEEPAPWDQDHELRWYAKHIQHGSNLGMTPHGVAREARIPLKQAQDMQGRYFTAFHRVRARQREIAREIRETGTLTNCFGIRKQFFGRLWDDHTIREGLAYNPQSMIAFIIDMAIWSIWKEFDLRVNTEGHPPSLNDPNRVWLLAQEHDAILGLVRKDDKEALKLVLAKMQIPCDVRGRIMVIGADMMVGQNFRKFDAKKPETAGGLVKW